MALVVPPQRTWWINCGHPVQAYLDHTERDDPLFFRPRDFQGIPLGDHRVLWGGGYRNARDDVGAGIAFSRFLPESSRWSG